MPSTDINGFPLSYPPNPAGFDGNIDYFTKIMGFSFIASLFQGFATPFNATGGGGGTGGAASSYVWNTISLLLLGLLVEMGRNFCQWLIQRISFQYTITAQFTEGDPAYEWIILFLTDAQVWKASRDFRVTATSSKRKWAVKPNQESNASGSTITSLFSLASLRLFWNNLPLVGDTSRAASHHLDEKARLLTEGKDRSYKAPHAEYVPTYETPQLFRWKGYWAEIRRGGGRMVYDRVTGHQPMSLMYLTIYTHDLNILSAFVEEARQGYVKTNRPHVIVHIADQLSYGSGMTTWSNSKSKSRRPLSSIILQEGVIHSLVEDVKEFMETEDWYVKSGIPHRRGYLLHGPPGTGKTSTIYAIAGELGLEVFSLSLASSFMDDTFLQRAVAAVPKKSILLIEDIDCAFPSPRDPSEQSSEDIQDAYARMYAQTSGVAGYPPMMSGKSRVTLSGLLNVLDGIGSEEGKIFFATTNHVEHLDPALMRPGRIDMKILYKLATPAQAEALFLRFYPEEILTTLLEKSLEVHSSASSDPTQDVQTLIRTLACQFRDAVPAHEFSTAELQGYLLTCKTSPTQAANGIAAWVESEMAERMAKKAREGAKKEERRKAAERRYAGMPVMMNPMGAQMGAGRNVGRDATSAPSPIGFPGFASYGITAPPFAYAAAPAPTVVLPPEPTPAPSSAIPSVDSPLSSDPVIVDAFSQAAPPSEVTPSWDAIRPDSTENLVDGAEE